MLGFTETVKASHKKGIDKKLLIGPAHGFSSVFEFIWTQYIGKFCLVYQLIGLDASR